MGGVIGAQIVQQNALLTTHHDHVQQVCELHHNCSPGDPTAGLILLGVWTVGIIVVTMILLRITDLK